MFFSRKTARKHVSPGRAAFGRRLRVESLENRRLLSVSLGSPTASTWIYGQTGESIMATVTVGTTNTPPPAGTEVFLINGTATTSAGSFTPILAKAATNSSGIATFNLSPLEVGSYNLVAEYTDPAGTLEQSSPAVPVSVTKALTTTSLSSTAPASGKVPFGDPIVFTATVTTSSPGGGIPTGLVTFEDTSTATPTVLGKAFVTPSPKVTSADTGVATFVDANLAIGPHTIVAIYAGSRNYMGSDTTASPLPITITNTATRTIASASPNPAASGAAVTLVATVLPAFIGPVPGPIVGPTAAVESTNPALPPIFNGPAGTVQFELETGSTTVVDIGGPVTLVNGRAVLTVPSMQNSVAIAALPVGIDPILAVYTPAASSPYAGSTSLAYDEVVLAPTGTAKTTTTVAPKLQVISSGSEAAFTITVTPATSTTAVLSNDTVYVFDVSPIAAATGLSTMGPTLLGTATYSPSASDWTFTTTTPLSLGPHEIEAVFAGDSTFASSTGSASVLVVPWKTPTP